MNAAHHSLAREHFKLTLKSLTTQRHLSRASLRDTEEAHCCSSRGACSKSSAVAKPPWSNPEGICTRALAGECHQGINIVQQIICIVPGSCLHVAEVPPDSSLACPTAVTCTPGQWQHPSWCGRNIVNDYNRVLRFPA